MPISVEREQPPVYPLCSDRAVIPERILFGRGEVMQAVRNKLAKVACTNVPVLIVGESGTGKEVIARHIHAHSPWHCGSFVRINCPAIPGTLLESEMFGCEKGAFTGASTSQAGLVDSASGGTLFLDGIGELEVSLQPKLLQLLQDGQFTRIGGHENTQAEVRIICAASHPLEADIETGHFRADLFYRINVVTVHLPPLRERRGDIPELTDYFLHNFSREFGRLPRPISMACRNLLDVYDWPGNIRQLENVIKRYVILDTEEGILAELSGKPPTADPSPVSHPYFLKQVTRHATRELERKVILDTLSTNRWNRKRTAEALHISYRALLYKMKQVGLPGKRSASSEGR